MPSLLQQLENNEAILLMYLAGELDDAESREVEAMLERDGGLRQELKRLSELFDATEEEVMADLPEPRRTAEDFAARLRPAMNQWKLDKALQAEEAANRPKKGFPWWMYTMSAAAVLIVGFSLWILLFATPPALPPVPGAGNNIARHPEIVAEREQIVSTMQANLLEEITDADRLDALDEAIVALSQEDEPFFLPAEP